jgi:hypothetical protein
VALPLENDLAAVSPIGSRQDLDQRRLAGSIITEKCVNFPFTARKHF